MFDEKFNYGKECIREYDKYTANPDSEQGQINTLKAEVAALKKSNNLFVIKVMSLVAVYNIVGAIVERVGNSYGWW